MDRQIVFIGQIPQDTDMLLTNKDAYIGLAKACSSILGISTLLNAFTCIPTTPASMQVKVTAGEIYSLQNIDNSAYGSLSSDTTHAIMKQGVILDTSTLTLTAPGTVGNSWNVLIQIGFSEIDTGSTVLPYYNASNPSVPWSGPNNSGTPNNTIRQDGVTIQAKIGVQAPTGTQVTPSPDSGFTGAFVVTVANGQTTITSGSISTYSGAPFITETLTQKISQATADLRYGQITAIQNGQYLYGVDTGSVNVLVATLSPAIGSYSSGMEVNVKVANTNTTTTPTINLNGLGAKTIVLTNGSAIGAGDLYIGGIAKLVYDGTYFQLRNPASNVDFSPTNIQNSAYIYVSDTGSANAYACAPTPAVASYGSGGLRMLVKITNANTGASTLNVSSLGIKNIKLSNGNNPNPNDIVAGMIAEFIYDGTNFQLMNPTMQFAFLGLQNYAASTTAANTYTASLSPAPTAYTVGMKFDIKFTNTNTGAATINLNSLGAISMVRPDGTALVSGDIQAGQICHFAYDGTNAQLFNPGTGIITAGNGLSKSASVITASKTVTTISGVTTLTNTIASGFLSCGGSSAYTVTLPSASTMTNKYFEFYVGISNWALTKFVTADGAKINQVTGATGVQFGINEGGMLYCDGSNWQLINLSLQPISMLIGLASPQSISNNTITKIVFDTVLIDLLTSWDTTNHRFTAKYPGTYLVTLNGAFQGSGVASFEQDTFIIKNGATSMSQGRHVTTQTFTSYSIPASSLVTLNGSTDYVEGHIFQNSGGSLTTQNGNLLSNINIVRQSFI